MSHAPRRLGSASNILRWFVLCAFLFLLQPLASAAAAEEETHIFNATLSLTGGDCSELAGFDPVPDPGCPTLHAPKAFVRPVGVAVDRYGNRYVASTGSAESGSGGHIDVFSSSGQFITGIPKITLPDFQVSLAVDSQGYLYVGREVADGAERLLRYKPTKYNPAAGEIEYADTEPPVAIQNPAAGGGPWLKTYMPLTINPANDHLLVAGQNTVFELTAATEENASGEALLANFNGNANTIALDSVRKRVYVADLKFSPGSVPNEPVVKVFNLEAPHELLFTIDGSDTPTARFVSETRLLPLAVDEATGHFFVGDMDAPTPRVYEYDEDANPVSTLEGFKTTGARLLQLAYDNSPTSPTRGYLFVPSHTSPGRSLAFEPIPLTAPPAVEGLSVSGITTADAILHGKVNPGGVETTYRIEYTSEEEFQANGGFAGAVLAGEGTLKLASEGIPVSAPASGLEPGGAYRFRILAESPEGQDEAEASFNTLASVETSTDCPNQALRTGLSALLPDCRAYELVTPTDTHGHPPFGPGRLGGDFTTRQVSPAGDKLPFRLEGAPLSGLEGTGSFNGDPYLATRTPGGWSSTYEGPSTTESAEIAPGSTSPDQGYSFWFATGTRGSALLGGEPTAYLRYPDGHSEPLGQGSLGVDPEAKGNLISEGGTHAIFATGAFASASTAVQLEPDAAPSGTAVIYDRTPDGVTHVVSLGPGDAPFGAGQNVIYNGASLDGEGVAFEVGNVLYLRHDNEETYEVAPQQALSGYELTCNPGTALAGATPSYEWLLDGTPVPAATSSTYTPNSSQAGSLLQCRVRAANAEGGAIAIGQALLVDRAHEGGVVPRGGVNELPQAPTVGQTLQCQTGSWSAEPSFAYQWYRDGDPIGGATSGSYQVQAADAQTQIQCAITATASGTSVLASSGPREVEPPATPTGESPRPTASTPALAVDFAGIAEGGKRLLFTQGGDLFAYDVEGEATTPFSQSALLNGTAKGDVTPVTVSADGSTAYFVSPSVLSSEPNPEGDIAQVGEQNLYRSLEGQVSFIATVTERDVTGATPPGSSGLADGLGLWVSSLADNRARVPARVTPDGATLLFKSRAALTDYDPEGHAEIYRYDSAGAQLHCISCNPSGAAASADATLQYDRPGSSREYFDFNAWLENLRADGRRAFFETSEDLVASDADGRTDVYEWEDQGVGGCAKPGGCLYLISSGQSGRDEHLWAVSASGDDVFFISADLLTGGDTDDTPSIYDARVGGGFASPPTPAGECLGEACQPAAIAPNDPTPASSSFQGAGNVKEEKASRGRRSCPKGKKAVRRGGKSRCVKKKQARKKHKQAKGNGRAGR